MKSKKIFAAVLSLVLIIAMTIPGTLAPSNGQDSAEGEFTVADGSMSSAPDAEPTVEPEAGPSLFERLMACTTLEELFALIDETPEEQLIEILRRELHVNDKLCNAVDFASFMSAFVLIPDFFSMPWEERVKMLREYYGVNVCEKTLQNWRDKLIARGYINLVSSNRNLWHTFNQDGRKVREIVDPESPEYKQYCALRSVILAEYAKMGISARSIWGDMVHQLYHEHGVYYYCKCLKDA